MSVYTTHELLTESIVKMYHPSYDLIANFNPLQDPLKIVRADLQQNIQSALHSRFTFEGSSSVSEIVQPKCMAGLYTLKTMTI